MGHLGCQEFKPHAHLAECFVDVNRDRTLRMAAPAGLGLDLFIFFLKSYEPEHQNGPGSDLDQKPSNY